MVDKNRDVENFRVTNIVQRGRTLSFAIYAVNADGQAYRVALHTVDITERDLFEFHHSQMVELYTMLS